MLTVQILEEMIFRQFYHRYDKNNFYQFALFFEKAI